MDSPFSYGRLAWESTFTNRDQDRQVISSHLASRVNTILISPRRWGKSSLMKQLGTDMALQDKRFRFSHIDLFSVRSEADFFRLYATEVLKSTGSKWDELRKDLSTVASKIAPFISLSMGGDELQFGIDLKAAQDHPEEILNLPELLAKKHKTRPIICLDEFQNISSFTDPLAFQKLLRSAWQTHSEVTYCLYGSKRSMMTEMFTRRSKPFYRFGEVYFLRKIAEEHWIPFIIERFASTGRTITEESAQRLTILMECHPYYVQQICHHLWTMTPPKGKVKPEMEGQALQLMMDANTILYQREVEGMSGQQIGLLLALAHNEPKLTSSKTMNKYRISSSAYVSRMKKKIEEREIIDTLEGTTEFVDPVFRMWLMQTFNY